MLKGSTPIRLSQIDMSPFVRAAKMNEAASLNLSNAVTKTISDFTKKQQKKRDDNANIEAIMDMLSLDKKTASAVYKDETVRDAFKIQQEAQGNFVRKQREQVELEILQGEQQRVQEQRDIFEKAIAVNTTPEGTVDMSGVRQSFADLGGRDESVFGDLFNVRGEIQITKEGIIKQDTPEGEKFFGQVPQSALGKEPTESELKLKQLEIDKLLAQIEKIKTGDTVDDDSDPFTGTEDPTILEFMSANPQFKTYEEAEKHLKEQGLL